MCMRNQKRIIALLLCMLLVMSWLPSSAFADDEIDPSDDQESFGVDPIEPVEEQGEPSEDDDSSDSDVGADDSEPLEESVEAQDDESDDAITTYDADTLEKDVEATDGNTYRIVVAFDSEAELPEGVSLVVEELLDDECQAYMAQTEELLASSEFSYVRFFDISLVDEHGEAVEPSAAVQVLIELLDLEKTTDEVSVIHFGDDAVCVDAETDGNTVSFQTDGFSVYGVIQGPEPIDTDSSIKTLADVAGSSGTNHMLMLSVKRSGKDQFFQATLNENGALLVTTNQSAGGQWSFIPVEGEENQYYISTMVDGTRYVIKNHAGNNLSFAENDGTAFEVTQAAEGLFNIKVVGASKWLQYSNSGVGIRLYTDANNAANSQIKITDVTPPEPVVDMYGLDGKCYGLVIPSDITGTAIMASETTNNSGTQVLSAATLLVRGDPMDRSDTLYVSPSSDITFWTFHAIEDDKYYLSAGVDGTDKYIRVDGVNVTLTDTPDEKCVLQVVPGKGARAGMIRLVGVDKAVGLINGSATNGFGGTNNANSGNEWFCFVDFSDTYTEDDFMAYSAKKVSISDTDKVKNGSHVVIYTRVWNDRTKNYEFYIVDHNGKLARAYESGDSIVWIGSTINTLPFTFIEYYYEGTETPNYYYDLQNNYSGKYLAPVIGGDQIMSDSPIGVNLNGRRNGDFYSTILAWDEAHYDYAGIRTENGCIVSTPMSMAETFYFAIMEEMPDPLNEVETVDHEALGITMRLVDFDGNAVQNAFLKDNTPSHSTKSYPGILSDHLGEDGYPTNGDGVSMGTLFADGVPANHLFIESTYEGSGYYEFDSTLNFASYDPETENFKVYKELGTIDIVHGNTIKHGQYMPFNDLTPGVISTINPENLYDALGKELTNNDPRKGEPLYAIPSPTSDDPNAANYYFGTELSANFIQPPSGLDAWGHDIIFEFTGDDDFWLYVDGELVLDLGGIHSAIPGKVNYRTGAVTYRNEFGKDVSTTLYDIFKTHYENRNPEASEEDVTSYLDGIFVEKMVNGKECRVFKDYTVHDIRIFFMERGAGASNLRMRFNLASVAQGQVLLSKEISGTDKLDYASASFPFQIYYSLDDGLGCTHRLSSEDLSKSVEEGGASVKFQTGSNNVPYEQVYSVGSETYEDVFLLKPGEIAAIRLPDETMTYKIVECGVRNNIYDYALVNGDPAATNAAGNGLTDYMSSEARVRDRAQITFSNHVDPNSLRTLTITKRLFDAAGNELSADADATLFKMRVYLGENLDYYRFGEYHVKDTTGCYCVFDSELGQFTSTGIANYEALDETTLEKATFRTSLNGAIDNIPAGYSIEIRNLLVGTKFMVRELDNDIPVGYGLRKWSDETGNYEGYRRVEGSYIVEAGEPQNAGTIRDNNDPHIEVHNQRGWGIRAYKYWSDADFMGSHEDVFLAVYVNGVLLDGTVRRIGSNSSVTYFFSELQSGCTFHEYQVREVVLEDPLEDENGSITYSSIVAREENSTFTLGGTNHDGVEESNLLYTVVYKRGEARASAGTDANVRTDSVTNIRVGGLKIVKTDMDGNELSGAVIELKRGEELVGRYTSNEDGLFTTAYLDDGAYTLLETKAPEQYVGILNSLSISVDNGIVAVSDQNGTYPGYDSETNTLTIQNKPFVISVIKTDKESELPLKGAHFSLYRQVQGHAGPMRDYKPIPGFEDIVTDEDGILCGIDESLKPGSYYIVETQAPENYVMPDQNEYLLTISPLGVVTINSNEMCKALTDDSDTVIYTVQIENRKEEKPPIIVPTGVSMDMPRGVLALAVGAMPVVLFQLRKKRKKP